MATTAATLIQRARRFVGDWPEGDNATASMTSNTTTLTVADSSIYTRGWLVQVGTEAMQVRATPSGTTVTVYRGARGSTAATHASGDTVLIKPAFLDIEYLDAINAGINATFPWLYQPVTTTLAADATSYEYNIPNMTNGFPIPYISRLQFREASDLAYRDFHAWTVLTGATPILKLRRPLAPGTLRVVGFGPLDPLVNTADTLSTLYPINAEDALTMFAAQFLLASGEARRVRDDIGIRDDRENANRTGSSMTTSSNLLQRFQMRIRDSGMPPMPKHIVAVV